MFFAQASVVDALITEHQGEFRAMRETVLAQGAVNVDALIAALPLERGPLRLINIRLLAELGDRRAVLPLIEVLLRDDWYAGPPKGYFARLLGKITGFERLERETANLERVLTRKGSARALADLGDCRAVGALMAVQDDPDERVRREVREALDRLSVVIS